MFKILEKDGRCWDNKEQGIARWQNKLVHNGFGLWLGNAFVWEKYLKNYQHKTSPLTPSLNVAKNKAKMIWQFVNLTVIGHFDLVTNKWQNKTKWDKTDNLF